jgi:hypothetical protein
VSIDSFTNTIVYWGVIIAYAGNIAFLVSFPRGTAWKQTAIGRHMMTFAAMIFLVLTLALFRNVLTNVLSGTTFDVLRAIVYTIMPTVFWHRVWVVYRTRHPRKHGTRATRKAKREGQTNDGRD